MPERHPTTPSSPLLGDAAPAAAGSPLVPAAVPSVDAKLATESDVQDAPALVGGVAVLRGLTSPLPSTPSRSRSASVCTRVRTRDVLAGSSSSKSSGSKSRSKSASKSGSGSGSRSESEGGSESGRAGGGEGGHGERRTRARSRSRDRHASESGGEDSAAGAGPVAEADHAAAAPAAAHHDRCTTADLFGPSPPPTPATPQLQRRLAALRVQSEAPETPLRAPPEDEPPYAAQDFRLPTPPGGPGDAAAHPAAAAAAERQRDDASTRVVSGRVSLTIFDAAVTDVATLCGLPAHIVDVLLPYLVAREMEPALQLVAAQHPTALGFINALCGVPARALRACSPATRALRTAVVARDVAAVVATPQATIDRAVAELLATDAMWVALVAAGAKMVPVVTLAGEARRVPATLDASDVVVARAVAELLAAAGPKALAADVALLRTAGAEAVAGADAAVAAAPAPGGSGSPPPYDDAAAAVAGGDGRSAGGRRRGRQAIRSDNARAAAQQLKDSTAALGAYLAVPPHARGEGKLRRGRPSGRDNVLRVTPAEATTVVAPRAGSNATSHRDAAAANAAYAASILAVADLLQPPRARPAAVPPSANGGARPPRLTPASANGTAVAYEDARAALLAGATPAAGRSAGARMVAMVAAAIARACLPNVDGAGRTVWRTARCTSVVPRNHTFAADVATAFPSPVLGLLPLLAEAPPRLADEAAELLCGAARAAGRVEAPGGDGAAAAAAAATARADSVAHLRDACLPSGVDGERVRHERARADVIASTSRPADGEGTPMWFTTYAEHVAAPVRTAVEDVQRMVSALTGCDDDAVLLLGVQACLERAGVAPAVAARVADIAADIVDLQSALVVLSVVHVALVGGVIRAAAGRGRADPVSPTATIFEKMAALLGGGASAGEIYAIPPTDRAASPTSMRQAYVFMSAYARDEHKLIPYAELVGAVNAGFTAVSGNATPYSDFREEPGYGKSHTLDTVHAGLDDCMKLVLSRATVAAITRTVIVGAALFFSEGNPVMNYVSERDRSDAERAAWKAWFTERPRVVLACDKNKDGGIEVAGTQGGRMATFTGGDSNELGTQDRTLSSRSVPVAQWRADNRNIPTRGEDPATARRLFADMHFMHTVALVFGTLQLMGAVQERDVRMPLYDAGVAALVAAGDRLYFGPVGNGSYDKRTRAYARVAALAQYVATNALLRIPQMLRAKYGAATVTPGDVVRCIVTTVETPDMARDALLATVARGQEHTLLRVLQALLSAVTRVPPYGIDVAFWQALSTAVWLALHASYAAVARDEATGLARRDGGVDASTAARLAREGAEWDAVRAAALDRLDVVVAQHLLHPNAPWMAPGVGRVAPLRPTPAGEGGDAHPANWVAMGDRATVQEVIAAAKSRVPIPFALGAACANPNARPSPDDTVYITQFNLDNIMSQVTPPQSPAVAAERTARLPRQSDAAPGVAYDWETVLLAPLVDAVVGAAGAPAFVDAARRSSGLAPHDPAAGVTIYAATEALFTPAGACWPYVERAALLFVARYGVPLDPTHTRYKRTTRLGYNDVTPHDVHAMGLGQLPTLPPGTAPLRPRAPVNLPAFRIDGDRVYVATWACANIDAAAAATVDAALAACGALAPPLALRSPPRVVNAHDRYCFFAEDLRAHNRDVTTHAHRDLPLTILARPAAVAVVQDAGGDGAAAITVPSTHTVVAGIVGGGGLGGAEGDDGSDGKRGADRAWCAAVDVVPVAVEVGAPRADVTAMLVAAQHGADGDPMLAPAAALLRAVREGGAAQERVERRGSALVVLRCLGAVAEARWCGLAAQADVVAAEAAEAAAAKGTDGWVEEDARAEAALAAAFAAALADDAARGPLGCLLARAAPPTAADAGERAVHAVAVAMGALSLDAWRARARRSGWLRSVEAGDDGAGVAPMVEDAEAAEDAEAVAEEETQEDGRGATLPALTRAAARLRVDPRHVLRWAMEEIAATAGDAKADAMALLVVLAVVRAYPVTVSSRVVELAAELTPTPTLANYVRRTYAAWHDPRAALSGPDTDGWTPAARAAFTPPSPGAPPPTLGAVWQAACVAWATPRPSAERGGGGGGYHGGPAAAFGIGGGALLFGGAPAPPARRLQEPPLPPRVGADEEAVGIFVLEAARVVAMFGLAVATRALAAPGTARVLLARDMPSVAELLGAEEHLREGAAAPPEAYVAFEDAAVASYREAYAALAGGSSTTQAWMNADVRGFARATQTPPTAYAERWQLLQQHAPLRAGSPWWEPNGWDALGPAWVVALRLDHAYDVLREQAQAEGARRAARAAMPPPQQRGVKRGAAAADGSADDVGPGGGPCKRRRRA